MCLWLNDACLTKHKLASTFLLLSEFSGFQAEIKLASINNLKG